MAILGFLRGGDSLTNFSAFSGKYAIFIRGQNVRVDRKSFSKRKK